MPAEQQEMPLLWNIEWYRRFGQARAPGTGAYTQTLFCNDRPLHSSPGPGLHDNKDGDPTRLHRGSSTLVCLPSGRTSPANHLGGRISPLGTASLPLSSTPVPKSAALGHLSRLKVSISS